MLFCRIALVTALSVVMLVPSAAALSPTWQEVTVDCASETWLGPIAEETSAAPDPEQSFQRNPAWLSIELIDACSGDTFTLADFAGKTIYIEGMATWCPPCRDQLARLKEAAAGLSDAEREAIVFVALSTEVDLSNEALAEYAASNGFPFLFAVMPVEMLQSMADDLGQEIAVPPATPHIIVGRDGSIGEIQTGSTSADDLDTLFSDLLSVNAP